MHRSSEHTHGTLRYLNCNALNTNRATAISLQILIETCISQNGRRGTRIQFIHQPILNLSGLSPRKTVASLSRTTYWRRCLTSESFPLFHSRGQPVSVRRLLLPALSYLFVCYFVHLLLWPSIQIAIFCACEVGLTQSPSNWSPLSDIDLSTVSFETPNIEMNVALESI